MSSGAGEPSEAELRAAWEEQLRLLTPADVMVQTAVSLISLAGRRLGLEPGTEGERDLDQVRDAIDGARALLPVLERGEVGPTLGPLRDAISALQLEYAKLASARAGAAPGAGPPADAGGAGDSGGGATGSGGGAAGSGGGEAGSGGGEAGSGGGSTGGSREAGEGGSGSGGDGDVPGEDTPSGRPPEAPPQGGATPEPGPAQRSGRLWVPGS